MFPQHLKSTIFGTIKDDVTGVAKSISIFNSSISDIKENLSNGQGFFYSVFQGNKLNNNDVQGILNYVKAMEDGVDESEALKTNLTGCSVAAQKYVNDAKNAGKSTEQMKAGLKDAATVGNGFKGVIANIGKTLGNMATGMAIGAAIQFAINTIITAFDNLVNAYKKSMEEMSNYQSNISSLKSEAESLNKELKDTKEKISAIESINPTKLNLFDEAELQRLKAYNDELERKLRLNKAQLEVDAKSADKTAKWTYANSQVDFNPLNKYFGDNANAQWYDWVLPFLTTPYFWGSIFAENATNVIQGNTWDQQMDYLSQTEQAQERYKKSVEEFEKFTATHDPVGEEYDKLLADKNQFENEFNNGYLANISSRYTDWQIELNSLNPDDLTNTERIKELEEAIARYDAIVNKMSGNKTFAEVYSSAEFSDVTKKLEELAKAGKLTEDTFNSVDGIDKFKEAIDETLTEGQTFADVITSIIARVNSLGTSAGDTGDQIKTLADRIAEINKNNSTSIQNISKIQNAISTMQSKDYLSFDDVSDLLEIDPSLADKFTQTTQGYKIAVEDLTEAKKKYTEESKKSVRTELENTNSDISSKKDEIKKLQEEKKRYETDLEEVQSASIFRSFYNSMPTDEGKEAYIKQLESDTNSTYFTNLVKDEEYAKQQEDEITKKIKGIETNIELANGKIEESGQLASVLKVILNEMSNPIDKQALSLSDVISKLSDAKDLLDTVKDEISSSGAISLETLEKISSSYPELENSVADYMMGLISASDLLKNVQKQYDNDTIAYRENIAEKIQLTDTELNNYISYLNTKVANSEDYYRNIGGLEKNFVDYISDNYNLDLKNCKTWAEAKAAMIAQTKLSVYGADSLYDFETMTYKDHWTDFVHDNTLQAVEAVQSIFDNYESAVEEFGKRSAVFNKADEFVANSSSKKNSTKSTTEEVFDWIEVRLTRLADKTKSFFDKVSDYVSNVTNERNLGKAINSTQNEIDANKKAEQNYRAKANSINLSEDWKKKVREGDFSIDELTDESLIKNIQDYQKWWEKAEESAQNIATLTEQQKDYQAQQFNSRLERQQRVTTKYSNASQKQNDVISMKQTNGKNVTASDYKTANKYFNDQSKSLTKENKLLGEQQKKVAKGSKEWQNLNDQIQSNNSTIRQNNQSIAENNKLIAEMPLNRAITKADNANYRVTYRQGVIDNKNASGERVTAKDYDNLGKAMSNENSALREQRKELIKLQNSTDKGSDAWNDYNSQLQSVNESIRSNTTQIAENNNNKFNAKIADMDRQIDGFKIAVSSKSNDISLKQTQGKKVTALSYSSLNNSLYAQNSTLGAENSMLEKQLKTVEKGSELWNQYTDKINSNNETIEANNQSIAENNKLIAEMPLNRAITKADNAGHKVTYQQGTIDDKNTSGKKVTAKDYDNLNKAISSENSALREQRKELVKLRDSTDKGSDAWNDYNSQLQSVNESIRSNTTQIKENNNKKFDIKIADYNDKVDKYQNSISDSQGKLDLRTAKGKKNSDYYYKQMIDASKNENKVLNNKKKAIEAELKTTQEGSERYRTLSGDLQSVNEQINQNKINQAEWNATIRNIPIDRLNEYLEIAEAVVSRTKAVVDRLSYVNGESTISAKQIYSQMYTKENLSKQAKLRDKYYSEWQKTLKEGRTKDAEEYQKLYLQADSTYNEMLKTNEELRRQGRDISLYRSYEQDLQHIEDVKKAMSSLSGMLNDDALYNDAGSFSEQGIAKIALTIKNLETAKKSAKDYKNEIDVLNKAYKQGKYNKDEYAEKLRELAEGYQGATSEINQYAEAIKDLYKNQAQEELNALNKLIEARSNALQKKKE